MKNFIIMLLIFITISTIGHAQDVKTSAIKWNSQSTIEANDGKQTEEVTSFICYGTTRMEWKAPNGSNRKNFQIVEAIGEWTDVNQTGRIQYEVTDGTSSGTISIKKNQNETKIFIALASEPPMSYVLTVSGHQVL